LIRDLVEEESEVKIIGKGEFFGEVALMSKGKRTATIKTENYSTISHINEQGFNDMRDRYPEI